MFIGLSEITAKCLASELGYNTRVLKREQNVFVGTRDLNTDRVNFHIQNGKVIKSWVG